VDSFVHPAHRNGLKNPGLFVSTVNAYVDAYSGHPDAMFFGWPNPVANRIGKRFLGYETVRKEHLLVRPLPGLPMEPLPEDPGFDASVFTLWKRCSKNYGASVVRDEPFLRWRFRDHPQFEYCYDILRNDKGAVRGYAIGRRTDRWLSRLYMIVDWLVVDDDLEAGEKLLRGAVAQAHGQGCTAIAGLFPEWSQWAEVLHARGFESFETEYELSVRSHDTRYGTDFYRDAWWYQLAESDIA